MLAWHKIKSIEAAETDSVVVEIPKHFLQLAGEQVRDELVNLNKMQTNLEGSVVEKCPRKKLLDC